MAGKEEKEGLGVVASVVAFEKHNKIIATTEQEMISNPSSIQKVSETSDVKLKQKDSGENTI